MKEFDVLTLRQRKLSTFEESRLWSNLEESSEK
jgi:hypothetical protein